MRILVLCDEGNNRSVTIAYRLKYWDHDVLTAGLNTNDALTLDMLGKWADRIIITEEHQSRAVPGRFQDKVQLWDVGPDTYPRPYNKELLRKVTALLREHEKEYKP